jgi:hypothetical protein
MVQTGKRRGPARVWMRDPHSGGVKIPADVRERVRTRIETYAHRQYQGKFICLDIRFRGPCCYIDAYREPTNVPADWPPKDWGETRAQFLEGVRNTPIHLCRLRYFGDEDGWSLAFFTYSNEKYSPCVFHNGSFFGTPEAAFDIGAGYLHG